MNIKTSVSPLSPKRAAAGLSSALILIFGSNVASAELALPSIFGSHMVLQQDGNIPVWGTEDPGEVITVSFAGKTVTTTADTSGNWRVALPEMETNAQGKALKVGSSSGDTITFEDVLVGEVWVCSGQSNMEWSVVNSLNSEEEIAAADFPTMRLFDVKNEIAYEPQSDVTGEWVICTPENIKRFSAVGYFFGRHVQQELHRPVGLISTNWGGTVAEAWTSAEALNQNLPEFADKIAGLASMKENAAAIKSTFNEHMASYMAKREKLYTLEADLESASKWTTQSLNDSDWESIQFPQNWEEAGHPDLDGMVWLRKTIEIPESWVGRELILRPGAIDEVDITWFNGQQVGGKGNIKNNITEFWNQPRDYRVPPALVHAGSNVIAIRVIDAQGQGGIWGVSADMMYLSPVDGGEHERIELAGEWKLKAEYVLPEKPRNPISPNQPTVLYNQMIAPLIPYGIRGAIWYQGESNAGRPEQYRTLLPTMIADWRQRWERGDFPFLVVQLANFQARQDQPGESQWAELREAQSLTAHNDNNTGLAVIIDIGEAHDIHPRNKQDVGKRLGLAAEAIAYQRDVVSEGPTFKQMEIEDNEIILHFDHVDGGLKSQQSHPAGFAICGASGEYVWAHATIQEDNSIRLSAEGVENPVAVRYAWANNPEAPLYNQAGLPMVPFRTDGPAK